jgi:hypothetical protein
VRAGSLARQPVYVPNAIKGALNAVHEVRIVKACKPQQAERLNPTAALEQPE